MLRSMEDTAYNIMQKYMQKKRKMYFNEVAQAQTEDGLNKAFDIFFELSDKEIAPGLTSILSKVFYEDHSEKFPEVAGIIARFHNRVIQKAFDLPADGNQVTSALEQVRSNANDMAYIINGNSDSPVSEDQFLKKMAEIKTIIKEHKPYFGMIDE